MYKVYGRPFAGSLIAEFLLNEVDADYEFIKVDYENSKKDDFLKSCAFSKIVTVEDDTVSLKIENIEEGNYAVSVYHDENNSGILETGGVFGIPLEPYGFSNNPNMTFGPSYKKSVFKMASDKNISIKLK